MMNVAIAIQREIDGVVMDEVGHLSLVAPNEITLGRNSTCDVRLESEEVSRHHARISLGHEGYVIEDSSNNGTRTHQGYVLYRRQGAFPYGTHFTIGPFRVTVGQPGQSTPPHGIPNAYGHGPTHEMRAIPRPPQMPHMPTLQTPRTPMPMPMPHPSQLPSSGAYPVGVVPAFTPSSSGGIPHASSGGYPQAANMNGAPQLQPQTRAVPMVDARTPQEVARARANELKNSEELVNLRRRVHAELLKNLDFAKIDPTKADPSLRPRVLTALKRIVLAQKDPVLEQLDKELFISELLDEALGLGPLEPLLADATVTEIMVVDPATIYVERAGKVEITSTRFTDEERVRAVIERIVTPLGRRIDESQPLVDARLADGSRVNAIIRPLALRGSCITIRRFPKRRLMVEDFIRLGSLTPRIAKFLERAVIAKKNILISGGTGSGKTTLLNVLSASIPSAERIVTIEDAAELQLNQPHVVSLETKHANMEGKGAFTIRDLVKNSLRMRPDRIVVGECRGGEALDMLQAMNTGHDGSITTIHANSPVEALARLETLVLMAGVDLPSQAIREQIARSIHVIVQQTRFTDGSRKITHVSEIDELDPNGRFEVREIFEYEQTGVDKDGKVLGDFEATGYLPSFVDEMIARGLVKPGEPFL